MVVYVLELKNGFYYVGRFSISQLKSISCISWTRLHEPVSVIETIYKDEEYDDEFCEDYIVYKYMKKYGIDKVRGGSFINTVLSEYQTSILNEKFKSNEYSYKNKEHTAVQFNYSSSNDFTTVMYDSSKKNLYTDSIKNDTQSVSSSRYSCPYCEMSFASDLMLKKHEQKCVDTYFTKSKSDGKLCERCGRDTHTTQYCKAKTDIHGYSI